MEQDKPDKTYYMFVCGTGSATAFSAHRTIKTYTEMKDYERQNPQKENPLQAEFEGSAFTTGLGLAVTITTYMAARKLSRRK